MQRVAAALRSLVRGVRHLIGCDRLQVVWPHGAYWSRPRGVWRALGTDGHVCYACIAYACKEGTTSRIDTFLRCALIAMAILGMYLCALATSGACAGQVRGAARGCLGGGPHPSWWWHGPSEPPENRDVHLSSAANMDMCSMETAAQAPGTRIETCAVSTA